MALFSNITVLPAILTILPFDRKIIKKVEFSSNSIVPSFTRRYSRIICIIGLIIGVISTTTLPNAEFDFDPMNLRDPSKESVATILDLMKDNQSSPYSVTILAKDLIEAQQLAVNLEKLDLVESVKTIADYVPVDQQEKLQLISFDI